MYDLHRLGWYGFQELCLTVAREIFGQTVVSFLDSRDGGRDGCFTGKWKSESNQLLEGNFVFQCKFSSQPSARLKFSDIADEVSKAEGLSKRGLCDIYILITNSGVSGPIEEKIVKKFKSVGIAHVLVFGSNWLFQNIRDNKRLRRLVPRVYGLGDLSQILDERVYAQGRTLLESLKDDLAKVVITSAYQKAAKALDRHSFVLLVGEPAAGKTTIASLLAMGALDQWQALTMKLDTAERVIDHWNPDDPNQFFWIDDAFGVTQYERTLVHQWNHHMIQIRAMLNKGARIVMTSRDYIYNAARYDLKETAFPLLQESQVVIDVHNLTLAEKKQMLYNHIKLGSQPVNFRSAVKPFLESISRLPRFIPETARRLGSHFFTKNIYLSEWHLKDFVDKQESFLIDVIKGLDKESQAALALIFMNGDRLSSPLNLKPEEEVAIKRMEASLGGCTRALETMNGNLVQFQTDKYSYWRFKHPTVGDAFSSFVTQSPELIEIYLRGNPVEKLLEQVTCGKMGIKKAIVISEAYFSLILFRLSTFTSTKNYKAAFLSKWGAKRQLHEFLSFRCSKEFLLKYIEENPEILDQVARPGLMLDSVSEVNLACKIFEYKLLPEEYRARFIETVSKYAITGEDLYALRSEKIKAIFKVDELNDLREKVKEKLIPNLDYLCADRQASFNSGDDADYHMQSLLENLETIETEFESDNSIVNETRKWISKLKEWVEENTADDNVTDREKLADNFSSITPETERSIFDDIDTP